MYYGIRWETKAALKGAIENYLVSYNEERIKASLGGLSIKEHRDKLAKCPAFSPKPLCPISQPRFHAELRLKSLCPVTEKSVGLSQRSRIVYARL